MAQPITWRNINAPNQSAAVQLARQGSQALTSGISGIGDVLQKHRDNEVAAANKLSDTRTQELINQIKSFDSTQLAEAKASGAFSTEALTASGINPKGVGSILDSLNTQDDRIFEEGQQQVQRTNVLRDQAQQDKTRTDVATLEGILADRSLDVGAKRDKMAALAETNKISSDLLAKYDDLAKRGESLDQLTDVQKLELSGRQQSLKDTTQAQVAQLESQLSSARAQVPSNPVKGTDEYAEAVGELNKYIDSARQGDRWFGSDLDTVKSEVNAAMEAKGASPAQAQAALSTVIDADGDYSKSKFKEVLQKIVDDPAADRARNRVAELQDAVNRVKIGLPQSQHVQQQALVQEFLNKRFQ